MNKLIITENMAWPPNGLLRNKMAEHSAWYSGDANILANFYHGYLNSQVANLPYTLDRDLFWARQIKNDNEIGLHIPLAGDIASTSADLLFSEQPIVKIAEAHIENAASSHKKTQEELNTMLDESAFFRRILEAAETCAAIGGGFIKLAWDDELSKYPIPVVEQADNAIPFFKFGILYKVIFWKIVHQDNKNVFRLLETYENDGTITYQLYKGTGDKLGTLMDVQNLDKTKDIEDVEVPSLKDILCVYVPNILPNRIDRNSYLGRSDYNGIEGLMDSLDETYSSWMKDVVIAQAKIMVPEQFLEVSASTGRVKYNVDKMVYATLNVDPTNTKDNSVTPIQFEIRADEFEKTSINLIERIITSAGYSPQTFGLNIQGRAESGTALNVRERKTFSTKNKKQAYWEPALKKLVSLMLKVYKIQLRGPVETEITITTQFSDSISNDISETSDAIQKIAQAFAASTETKVRMLHPDWSDAEVLTEAEKIIEENNLAPFVQNPDDIGKNKPGGQE